MGFFRPIATGYDRWYAKLAPLFLPKGHGCWVLCFGQSKKGWLSKDHVLFFCFRFVYLSFSNRNEIDLHPRDGKNDCTEMLSNRFLCIRCLKIIWTHWYLVLHVLCMYIYIYIYVVYAYHTNMFIDISILRYADVYNTLNICKYVDMHWISVIHTCMNIITCTSIQLCGYVYVCM